MPVRRVLLADGRLLSGLLRALRADDAHTNDANNDDDDDSLTGSTTRPVRYTWLCVLRRTCAAVLLHVSVCAAVWLCVLLRMCAAVLLRVRVCVAVLLRLRACGACWVRQCGAVLGVGGCAGIVWRMLSDAL